MWTEQDDQRLIADGWSMHARRLVEDLIAEHAGKVAISKNQLEAHQDEFGFAPTSDNLNRVRRVILHARASACDEATKQLMGHPAGIDGCADAAMALADPSPAENRLPMPAAVARPTPPPSLPSEPPAVIALTVPEPAEITGPKKLFTAASEIGPLR